MAHVMTEDWLFRNSYCPSCGADLVHFENNRPVADFYCQVCKEEYELKSKQGSFSHLINDGAYQKMLERVSANNNPHFFFLTYDKSYLVENLVLLPKYFFTKDIIIPRKALAPTARRAGWVGCQIDLSKTPEAGKIFLVKSGQPIQRELVLEKYQQTAFIREKELETRGWLLEVLKCLDKIPEQEFSLPEVYAFVPYFKTIYPDNNNIEAKIRQQLQVLRDKGLIEFLGKGRYRKKI